MEKRIISDAKGKYELNLFSSGAQLPEFIPQHVRDRVNKWISNYLLQPAYSCAGFTYFMVTGNDVPKVKVWNIFPSEDNTNCLLLRQSKDEKDGKFHFAFTVPEMNNMYLSQFGNGGALVLCTLEAMERYYETDKRIYISNMKPDQIFQ